MVIRTGSSLSVAAVDDLAQHTFVAPMEGYIRRMLWCLRIQGVIPEDAAHDPWGPAARPGRVPPSAEVS